MKRKLIPYIVIALLPLASCKTTKIAKIEAFPKMYDEVPVSIAVAPPINNETAAEAGDFYLSTVAVPSSLHGYYIFPIPIVMEMLKDEGVYNTLGEIPQPDVARKFYELIGADATLFTTIERWDKKYRGIYGSVEVLIDYRLVSGKTGELLWSHAKLIVVDTSGGSGGAGGLVGLAVKAITTAIQTAAQDYVPVAMEANNQAFVAFPFGKYHPSYLKDQNTKVVVYKSKVEETGAELDE